MKYILLIVLICFIVIYINFYYYPYILKLKTPIYFTNIPKTGGTSFIEKYLFNPFKISWHYPVTIIQLNTKNL